uniref:Uncharacterized protein n=1 Tax=Rhizophora mucronata TaxID=61149 RepID=A0A2P2M624_RHIMU
MWVIKEKRSNKKSLNFG